MSAKEVGDFNPLTLKHSKLMTIELSQTSAVLNKKKPNKSIPSSRVTDKIENVDS